LMVDHSRSITGITQQHAASRYHSV
jgi:hypothetical protein